MTFVLGITGGIATGKSTVSELFTQYAIPVIDADQIAREVVEPGTIGLQRIVDSFGKELLRTDGTLDRKKLGQIVFSNADKRLELDQLLAEEIRFKIQTAKKKYIEKKVPLLIVNIPLLYEAKYEDEVDQVMVVFTEEEIQLNRLIERNHLTKLEAQQRINSQLSLEEKIRRADCVINNSGTLAETKKQVIEWLYVNHYIESKENVTPD